MIPSPDLRGGQQFGKRKNHQTFNGALQMARTVLRICAFVQKEYLRLRSTSKCKLWTTGCLQYALLNQAEFDIQNALQVFRPQCLEDDHVVNSLHELRGELSPGRLLRRTADLFIEAGINIERPLTKSKPSAGDVIHLRRAQVGGHENQALGKVNAPVISKR